jgi:RimJ/RimL family protein N-acetyltransferase
LPETERLALRRVNWPDIDDVVAMSADAEVMRHHDHGLPLSPAHVLAEEMPRLMAHNGRADQLGCWTARDRATGDFLGWFSVTPAGGRTLTVELDYRLQRKAWGKGYGIEGTLCMIEMASAAQMAAVIGTAMPLDLEYRRVMELAGLRLVPIGMGDGAMKSPTAGERALVYVLDLSVRAMLPA